MEKLRKFDELNQKYHQFLIERLNGEENVTVGELRQLAEEAGISDELEMSGTDEEFLKSLRLYFRTLIRISS